MAIKHKPYKKLSKNYAQKSFGRCIIWKSFANPSFGNRPPKYRTSCPPGMSMPECPTLVSPWSWYPSQNFAFSSTGLQLQDSVLRMNASLNKHSSSPFGSHPPYIRMLFWSGSKTALCPVLFPKIEGESMIIRIYSIWQFLKKIYN